jgi:hypothetical protein
VRLASLRTSGAAGDDDEDPDPPSQYEKDMTTLEAQQDIYFALFAALLNVSVMKSIQPLVAKKGLMVSEGGGRLGECLA